MKEKEKAREKEKLKERLKGDLKPEQPAAVGPGPACVHSAAARAFTINGKWMSVMRKPISNSHQLMHGIVEENAHAIGQLIGLLDELPGALYRRSFGSRKQHVIGKHVRHIIDHYSALLAAASCPEALLDYENRNRELTLETDRRAGRQRLAVIVQELRQGFSVRHGDELLMRHTSEGEQQLVKTSVDRELVFLASHTIHHMAIVAMLAEQAGVEVSPDFGVHPSTLRYLQKQTEDMARSA